jgi:hypothetical protein
MNDRTQIERKIVGACLHGFWMSAVNLLKAQNFRDEVCRDIFEIVSAHCERIPIDPITVGKLYREKVNTIESIHTVLMIHHECEMLDVKMYCLMLLEIDMRTKFTQLLRRYEESAVKENDFESASIWKQVGDHIASPANDVFEAIEQGYQYIRHARPDEADEYEEMRKAIPALIGKVRSQARFFMMLENLRRHAKEQGNREDLFRTTTEVFFLLLTNPTLPPKLEGILRYLETDIL